MSSAYTDAELAALASPISNSARVLYMLGLRPTANRDTGATEPVQYKPLLELLNGDGKSETFLRGRQINSLIRHLEDAGLINVPSTVDLSHSINGMSLVLPLLHASSDNFSSLHTSPTAMHTQWKPNDQLFTDLAVLVGIIDKTYDEHDVGEFIAYWLGKPHQQFTQYQWTQKFVNNLKQKRINSGYTATTQIGTQTVKVEAGLEADDNAKALVEKYATLKKT